VTGSTTHHSAPRPPYLLARSDKREQARQRVERAALALFAKQGFDAVTVQEICGRAGVSPATFYRYFGSKEGVIFRYEEGFVALAVEIGGSVDARASAADQVVHILERCAVAFEAQSEARMLRDEIVLANADLLQRTHVIERRFEDALGRALAATRQEIAPSTATLVDAGICMIVIRVALIRWNYAADQALTDVTREIHAALKGRLC
jgi:AcrR family transcriptional regulator